MEIMISLMQAEGNEEYSTQIFTEYSSELSFKYI